MKPREFRCTTIVLMADMLEDYRELTNHLHLFPVARAAARLLDVNRNHDLKREPFTEWDIMPELGAPPKPSEDQQIAREKQIFAAIQQAGVFGPLEIDYD